MNPKLPLLDDPAQPPLRVALCQVHTAAWDCDGNTQRTLAALQDAARHGADLAVTPECVLHGYGFGENAADTRRRYAAAADTPDSPRLRAVRDVARALHLNVIVGFLEARPDGLFHNAAAIIGSDGMVRDIYRKVHCRTFESVEHTGAFTPGDRFVASNLAVRDIQCRVGTMICFDREIPESVRCLRALGAHVVACPLACDTERLDVPAAHAHNELITQCRAAENELFIVVVNHAGRFNGGSFAVGPGGEVLTQLGAAAEVRLVALPVMALAARVHADAYGWMGWGYRRPEVYNHYLAQA